MNAAWAAINSEASSVSHSGPVSASHLTVNLSNGQALLANVSASVVPSEHVLLSGPSQAAAWCPSPIGLGWQRFTTSTGGGCYRLRLARCVMRYN